MTSVEVSPEVPEPHFQEAEAAFKESLGSDFGTASIIEGEQAVPVQGAAEKSRRMSVMQSAARRLSVCDRRVAGVLAIVLGQFGMHKFYLGYHAQGFLLLLATIVMGAVSFGLAVLAIWMVAFVEGVIYFTLSQEEFERIYVDGTRSWF